MFRPDKRSINVHFSKRQLRRFKKELKKAGSIEQFMVEKEAMEIIGHNYYLRSIKNEKKYMNKHLSHKDYRLNTLKVTTIPYLFWWNMFKEIQQYEKRKKRIK